LTIRRIKSETSATWTPSGSALEAIPVEQRHEELEVLLLAVVRRGRHQEEVPGQCERTAELVALVYLISPPKKVADILWASSQTMRSSGSPGP